jgi:hypothetical protein
MDLEEARRRRDAGMTSADTGRTATPGGRARDARLRREIREAFDRQRAGHVVDAAAGQDREERAT